MCPMLSGLEKGHHETMLLDLFLSFLRLLLGGYVRPHTCFSETMKEGPALLVCNHPTVLDPVVLGLWSPRRPRYLVAGHLFDNPFMGWFFRWTNCIPVGREGAFEAAAQALERGECVGIFPEATMTGQEELLEFRSGVARLALRTGAPIYALGIAGTLDLFPPASHWLKPGPVALCAQEPFRFLRQEEPSEETVQGCLHAIKREVERQVRIARRVLVRSQRPGWLGTLLSGTVLVPLAFVLRRSEPV